MFVKRVFAIALVAAASVASTAFAGPWSTPAGSQPHFNYSSGSDLNNLFATPVSLPGGFKFSPQSMTAAATNDATSNVADTTSVVLTAAPNRYFSWISAGILGDYSILGAGSVNSTGQVRVRNLDTMQVLTQSLTFTPGMPVETNPEAEVPFASGLFESNGVIALPFGWKNIKVELDGLVNAYADLGAASLIQAKSGHINAGTEVIPLPPAVLAAIPAIAIAGYARKRMTRKV
jgi:hypothetical protein